MKLIRGLTFAAGALASSAGLLYTQGAVAQTAAQALLEEVVVTARRREESLEDLPLSVVAISGEAMQAQGIYNTEQLGEFAANVSLSSSDRMNHSRIFIRGIGGGFPNPVAVFGTGMYIDGHYLPGSLANYSSTVDIERVEVLRGPQGTLFGKNVTGGAVNIISAKPGPEFESSLTARVGDFGQQDLRGMINVPINDNLFFRGSVSSEQSDGYYDNIFLGTNVDFRDSLNTRAAFRWTPGDNWTIDAALTSGKDRNGQLGRQCRVRPRQSTLDELSGAGQDVSRWTAVPDSPSTSFNDGVGQWGGGPPGGHINRLGPTTVNGQVVTTDGLDSVITMWDWCDRSNAAGEFATAAEKDHYANSDTNAVFASANWDSGGEIGGLDNLQIRTNVSWRDADFNWIVDRDSTPLPIDVLGHVAEDDGSNLTTRNFEMIFDLDVNDRLSMLFGFYLFEEESLTGDGNCWPQWQQIFNFDTGQTEGPDTPCGPGSGGGTHGGLIFEFLPDRVIPGGPGNAFQNVNLFNDSTAVFAHATYALNDNWDLEVGARWTEDDRYFNIIEFDTGTGATFNGQPFNTCNFLGTGICQPTPVLNQNNVVNEGFFNEERAVFDEITPMISLTRNLAGGDTLDSGMVYFLYSEGFLTGSFNDELNLFLTPELAPLVVYQPETVSNFEVGFKGTFADGRVRLNADIFFMDYQDKQEGIQIDNFDGRFGPDPSIELTQNAGQVDIYGIELELRASPWDGGFITVDASYLENEYSEFLVDDVDNPGGPQLDLSNTQIGDRTPDWTINASVGHTFVLGSGATLTPQIGMYAQGEYDWLAGTGQAPLLSDAPSVCNQGSYSKWRTRVTYSPAAGNWEASLFGSNITDERIFQECDYARTGVYDYRYERPDAWGLEFVARFGNN